MLKTLLTLFASCNVYVKHTCYISTIHMCACVCTYVCRSCAAYNLSETYTFFKLK